MATDIPVQKPLSKHIKEAQNKLLKKCKMDNQKLKMLFSILKKYRTNAESADDLVTMFADKCYNPSGDALKKAKEDASYFCETAFGGAEQLFRLGPEDAFATLVNKHAEKLSANMWEFEFGDYYIGPVLGVGGTAKVYLGYDKKENKQVAVKVYTAKHAKNASKEGAILKSLNHRNIINVYDVFENCKFKKDMTTIMVMEYANQGELIEYLMYTKRFEPPLARWIFRGLLEAVSYCHAQDPQIIHRDLKHDNALFSLNSREEFVLKINDFGFSHRLSKGKVMKSMIGTKEYAAPELLLGKPYDGKCDIFSLGVMLFVMLAGVQPFKRADYNDKWYKHVTKGKWKAFWDMHINRKNGYPFPDEEKNILEGMLAYNPKDRTSLASLYTHPWLASERSLKHTYTSAETKIELERRKMLIDCKKYKSASSANLKASQARDVAVDQKPALSYHTNIPATGLWFYSDLSQPGGIISAIDAVIREDCRGTTDYDCLIAEDEDAEKEGEEEGEQPADVEDNKEEGEGSGTEIVSLFTDTSGMSALEAMKFGQYRLNFFVTINKKKQRGMVNVYSCPDDPKMHIVMFTPGLDASTRFFPCMYEDFLNKGVSALMSNPEAVRAKFEKMAMLDKDVDTPPILSFNE